MRVKTALGSGTAYIGGFSSVFNGNNGGDIIALGKEENES